MQHRKMTRWRSTVALGAAALMTAGVAIAGAAEAGEGRGGEPRLSEAWAQSVWTLARDNRGAALEQALRDVPEAPVAGMDEIRLQSSRLLDRYAQRDARQAEQVAEARAAMADHLTRWREEGSNLAIGEALRSAVELSLLVEEKDHLLREPQVQELIRIAERAARDAESSGDWLVASELFYRLHVLLEEQRTYHDDSMRQSKRLAMLRLYVPERFWELRNARRLAEDQSPLPPYNAVGDSYRDKIAGVDRGVISRALQRAADGHVEGATMASLLEGGLNAVETFATTADLAAAFPRLGDQRAVKQFTDGLTRERAKIAGSPMRLGVSESNNLLNNVLELNRRTLGIPEEAILHAFGNGAMGQLDEFSAIIWPDELARFQRSIDGAFIGVGIQIQMDELFNIKVVTPIEGTPAQRAGIRAGDLIKKVNGEVTAGFTLDQAVDLITGPAGTRVVLTIEREDANGVPREIEVPIVRDRIELRTVKGWRKDGVAEDDWDWFIDSSRGIGYIRLTQFTENTTRDFDHAVVEMKADGLRGLILDLRYNPGGRLDQAVNIANRFIDDGPIVTVHDAADRRLNSERARRGRATLQGIPVIVLVNENSASASEIVSGAIQDYATQGRIDAIVLGDRTFGKGSVQNVWPLGPVSAMKLTTQYYKLPLGRLIHRRPGDVTWGVEPDLIVKMLPSQMLESLEIRLSADVLPMDEHGNIVEDANRRDPSELLDDGHDLQLHTALVLLQARGLPNSRDTRHTMQRPAGVPN
ncbi:MAG: S41 family peptidase [Phycisphaerales bacterium]|nr:MAG: S41 family peptidase [Phycisphaerales bacterium]